ncbi:NADPH-dependent FMN reductase [Nocardia brasiliensis]|uniref:NADPH-dependent FMN reductase n=1 Tax=Nocardia brasiliensis TaxID=37326 RepID=A0A6G9XYP5_NOCBR|nr:NAD(P)H-dependent oxidoreductase [Nocardia brasiliensis]QIS06044.1 NADPH-dependent FMN reductase [Nocardia brasiliensis]
MAKNPVRLAVIVGSTRAGRFGPTVATWFARCAEQRADIAVEVIDLAQDRLPAHLTNEPELDDARALRSVGDRLAAADAFVIVTPEYNHSYPAALKNAIDWHFTEWRAKPVGFVSYGGVSGGLRAVEHLRHVFAELHAVTVRDTVSFHGAAQLFDASGELVDPQAPRRAADQLLDQIVWWGTALREARAERPYVA